MKKILLVLLVLFIVAGYDLLQNYPNIKYTVLVTGIESADININNVQHNNEALPFVWSDVQIIKPFNSIDYSIYVQIESTEICTFSLYCNDRNIYTESGNYIAIYIKN